MDFSQLFDLKFLVLCLVTTAVTHVAKALLAPIRSHRLVRTMVIPSLAICIGAIAGYFLSTVTVGLIAGLLSSLVYAKVRAFIKAK